MLHDIKVARQLGADLSLIHILTAILVLRQYGAPKVLEMIGADATGLPFNSNRIAMMEIGRASCRERA